MIGWMLMRALVLSLLLSGCLQLPPASPGEPYPTFAAAEAVLREVLPVGRPVDVRICCLRESNAAGLTLPGPLGSLVVLVEEHMLGPEQVRALVHEWAHAMSWGDNVCGDHDEAWGVAYSRAYRAVIEGWTP